MPQIQLLYCCLNYLADVGIPLAQNKIPTFHIQGPLSPGRGPCFYAHPGLDAARAAWAWVLAHNSFLRPLFNAAALGWDEPPTPAGDSSFHPSGHRTSSFAWLLSPQATLSYSLARMLRIR